MTLRFITQSTFDRAERASGDGVSVFDAVELLVTQSNYQYFSRKYAQEIKNISSKYSIHTAEDTRLLLTLIGRVNPDFSSAID